MDAAGTDHSHQPVVRAAQHAADRVRIARAGADEVKARLAANTEAAVARGVLLVAAVGNSGPNAPVAYPAAYPSVVAATAVDASDRVFLFANRGPQVAFAALGVDVEAAAEGDAYTSVSGTSFAAPRVAAALAALRAADPKAAIETLARRVRDLGAPGRDVVYGFGRAL
jgi:subtilisin family serine protease